MSQGSESNLVKTTTGIETNQKGLLTVSEDGSTTREGVFAGGDAVMGRPYRGRGRGHCQAGGRIHG